MDNKPLVSVVIPVYNGIAWIEEAIGSVLRQTYENYEIIVVDDGSTDDLQSLNILHDDRIRYYRNVNHGVAFSRNFGMEKASGKYIAFLDSDDFWAPDKLEIQIAFMEKNGFIWSQHNYYYYSDAKKQVIRRINTYLYRSNPAEIQFCSFPVQTSCFVILKEAVLSTNCRFDENKTFGEDLSFYREMLKRYELGFIDSYLGYFRIKHTNSGKDISKQIISRAIIWEESKGDSYFADHTSVLTRWAYKVCYKANVRGICNRSKITQRIWYMGPWLLFKIETIRMRIANTQ